MKRTAVKSHKLGLPNAVGLLFGSLQLVALMAGCIDLPKQSGSAQAPPGAGGTYPVSIALDEEFARHATYTKKGMVVSAHDPTDLLYVLAVREVPPGAHLDVEWKFNDAAVRVDAMGPIHFDLAPGKTESFKVTLAPRGDATGQSAYLEPEGNLSFDGRWKVQSVPLDFE